MKHVGMKVQALLALNKVDEAVSFTTQLQNNNIGNPEFLFWRGKVLIANNNAEMGKKHLREALNHDPDNVMFQKALKGLVKMENFKKEANELFQAGDFEEAIHKFDQCLEVDPHNGPYNCTILFNRSMAKMKLNQTQEAIKDLDKAIEINDMYLKAYVKRAELKMSLELYNEALQDFEKVK